MLDNLPPEILEQILGHLPSASSIANLDRVNHRLHASVSADQYAVFRNFVQSSFPTIRSLPPWRDMAKQLTSRSRAWDRRSFIARECYPDIDDAITSTRSDNSPKFGYTPVIDSYEEYVGGSPVRRRSVLAYGAAGRLRLRISENDKILWSTLSSPEDHLPQHDVVDVRLLKPRDYPWMNGETLLVRRANKSIIKVKADEEPNHFSQLTQYMTGTSNVDCMDISTGLDGQLAVFDKISLQLFPLHSDESETQPTISSPILPKFTWQNRKKCARFLNSNTIATSVQFVQGLERAPILIYDITPSSLMSRSIHSSSSIAFGDDSASGRRSANVLTNLDSIASTAGRPGEVFLSGWTDACVHLHDLRTPYQTVSTYWDPVDNGKILSLATYGHEQFFAGSHQNGCLKMFDLRMAGARPYSYLDVNDHQTTSRTRIDPATNTTPSTRHGPRSTRGINIFVAPIINQRAQLWQRLPPQTLINEAPSTNHHTSRRRASRHARGHQRQQSSHNTTSTVNNHHTRYRGAIYSLSTPSPSSPTLFAGIENHVIQLDFVSTDDVRRHKIELPAMINPASKSETPPILNLSCYERPRSGHEATDPVLLRKQTPWSTITSTSNVKLDGSGIGVDVDISVRVGVMNLDEELEDEAEHGWDERWRMGKSWKGRVRAT